MQPEHPVPKKPAFLSGEMLLYLHFFICSIGLLKVIYIATQVIYARLLTHSFDKMLFYFFSEYSYFSEKAAELLQYALSIGGLFVYYGFALLVIGSIKARGPGRVLTWATSGMRQVLLFYAGVLLVNILTFVILNPSFLTFDATLLFVGLWLLALLFPVLEPLLSLISERISGTPVKNRDLTKVAFWLIVLLSVQMLTVFAPFVMGPLRVANDFMDIPEETKLGDTFVDNTTFINAHTIGGLNKYDPKIDAGGTPSPRPGTFAEIHNDALAGFVTTYGERRFGADRLDKSKGRKRGTRDSRFYYDEKQSLFAATDRITEEERIQLSDLAANTHERSLLNKLFEMASANALNTESRRYTPIELEFFQHNRIELTAQAKAGWFFHHHNAMLSPINAFSLGKPATEIETQYGWLNSIILSKLTDWIGGMSFENYFSALYLFFPAYLAIVIFVAWLMLRNPHYVLLVAILSFSAMLVLGQELLRIAPGFNPIRHFLDLFIVLGLYLYGKRENIAYLLLSIALGWLAILCSREFGLFIVIALTGVLATKQIMEGRSRRRTELLALILMLAGAIACLTLVIPAEHSLLIYSLIGVSAPSFQFTSLYFLLIALSMLYVAFGWTFIRSDSMRWPMLFLFLYCQGFTIYYVWHPSLPHLLALAPVWALLLTMVLMQAFDKGFVVRYQQGIRVALGGILLIVLYLPVLAQYYFRDFEYRQIFATHKVYQWDFDRAKFETTMDPAYFQNAVGLISKYSASGGIFIVSKYDTILPFLSGRYSAMPYHDVATSLVTQKEVDQCVNAILSARPEYIFVDTDIERNLNGDIWLQGDPLATRSGLYTESFARASVLNLLKKVYQGVKSQYEPLEKGFLVTVYKMKTSR